MNTALSIARARAAFVRACELDALVRKPGNVSIASPGHGMDAAMFFASARAAAGPLFEPGARVGRRIELAVDATLAAARCNTNLGIVLLCAPIAAALERCHGACSLDELQTAVDAVLVGLDVHDTQAAYRAIARANPGGLGTAAAEDVHTKPSLGLRAAMALAADRDSIARQYRDAFAEVVEVARSRLQPGFSLRVVGDCAAASGAAFDAASVAPPSADTTARVQAVFLAWLGSIPDSHIVRKRGDAAAHTVMREANVWASRSGRGEVLDLDPRFAAWDDALKSQGINPGTTADLTVATLWLAAVAGASAAA